MNDMQASSSTGTANSALPSGETVRIELITDENDIASFFETGYQTFGKQTRAPYYLAMHPRMDTPEGYAQGCEKLKKHFRAMQTKDHTWFLKAVVIDAKGVEHFGGGTIWTVKSLDKNPQAPTLDHLTNVDRDMYPGDEKMARFTRQSYASFVRRRIEVIQREADRPQGALPVMVLDLCCVHPDFQMRGLASRMVQWGLEYADRQRNGRGIPCYTEASRMGCSVYTKLGFQVDSPLRMDVDDEFKTWPLEEGTSLFRPAKEDMQA